jgi:hypothetical protein
MEKIFLDGNPRSPGRRNRKNWRQALAVAVQEDPREARKSGGRPEPGVDDPYSFRPDSRSKALGPCDFIRFTACGAVDAVNRAREVIGQVLSKIPSTAERPLREARY